jgi:hypothetical protein
VTSAAAAVCPCVLSRAVASANRSARRCTRQCLLPRLAAGGLGAPAFGGHFTEVRLRTRPVWARPAQCPPGAAEAATCPRWKKARYRPPAPARAVGADSMRGLGTWARDRDVEPETRRARVRRGKRPRAPAHTPSVRTTMIQARPGSRGGRPLAQFSNFIFNRH